MRRFLIAAAAIGALAVGRAATAGPPVEFVGWNHHHHHAYPIYYPAPVVRYYRPPVVVARPVIVAPTVVPDTCGYPSGYYSSYYPGYYPGNYLSLGGRNFAVQFGW